MMISDRERAQELCNIWTHDWREDYYGYTCQNCGEFIPYGCEPWAPLDDDWQISDEYDHLDGELDDRGEA